MSLAGKDALITGSSRGIGRGIALKLAEKGARIGVHYHQNEAAAKVTLAKVRELGSDGFLVQADVCHPEEVRLIFARTKTEFGKLDIFVHNARPDLPGFYTGPMNVTLEQWDTALDSQAKAFLVGVREAIQLMRDGGRILAITYTPGGRFGSWQPWVAMGSAKAAMESLCRYFAVALAKRHITVNAISPGWRGQRSKHAAGGGAAEDSRVAGRWLDTHGAPRHASGHRQCRSLVLLGRSKLDHGPDAGGGRGCVADGDRHATRYAAAVEEAAKAVK